MRETEVELESTLDADPAIVWARVTSLAGIAAELPWPLRLTTEPTVATIDEFLAAGSVRGTLRIGPVPILRWHPGIVELGDRHFVEASGDMTFMHTWRHERRVRPAPGGGTIVRDRVTFESRVPGAALLVRWLFQRRHASLTRRDQST
jgi:ligand-binding SRPBCC domain-containing protein